MTEETASKREQLRQAIERLQTRLVEREDARDELERRLRHFYVRYREELGPLVERLLELRKQRLEEAAYRNRRSARRRNAFHDAEAEFERFRDLYEAVDEEEPPDELSDEEKQRLKSCYRKASKQCHPDMVDEHDKEKATEVFNQLREAYQQNQLERVEAIAGSLEARGLRGSEGGGQSLQDLRQEVERLRARIEQVDDEIAEHRNSQAYRAIDEIDDVESYVRALKQRLKVEIRRFQRGFRV